MHKLFYQIALIAALFFISSISILGQGVLPSCAEDTFNYPHSPRHNVHDPTAPKELRQIDKVVSYARRLDLTFRPRSVRVIQGEEKIIFEGIDKSATWYAIYHYAGLTPPLTGTYILPADKLSDTENYDAQPIPPYHFSFEGAPEKPAAEPTIKSIVKKLPASLDLETAGMKLGYYWFTLQSEFGSGANRCYRTTPPVVVQIISPLHVTIYPPKTDLRPVRTESITAPFKFTANVKGGTSPYEYEWQVGSEFSGLNRNGQHLESEYGLEGNAGRDLPINVKIKDRAGMTANNEVPSYLYINNLPTVKIVEPGRVVASSIPEDSEVTIVAQGEDIDNSSGRALSVEGKEQSLEYTWKLEGKDYLGNPVDPETLRQIALVKTDRLTFKTGGDLGELAIGNYDVYVSVYDGKNSSKWEKFPIAVVRQLQTYTFGFNLHELNKKNEEDGKFKDSIEIEKLNREITWLKEDKKRKLIIRVEGYADQVGTDDYNDCLGCRRARFIRKYLADQGVKNHEFLLSVSYGESDSPIPASASRAERRPDRKVVIRYYRSDGMTIKEILDSNIYGGSPLPEKERVVDCSISCLKKPKAGKKPSRKKVNKGRRGTR